MDMLSYKEALYRPSQTEHSASPNLLLRGGRKSGSRRSWALGRQRLDNAGDERSSVRRGLSIIRSAVALRNRYVGVCGIDAAGKPRRHRIVHSAPLANGDRFGRDQAASPRR